MESTVLFFLLFLSCSNVERIEGSEVGDCSDGADNDMDGSFDCDDSSCKGSSDCDETIDNIYEEEEEEEEEEDEEDEEEDEQDDDEEEEEEDDDDEEEEDDDDENNYYDPSLIGNPENGEILYERNCSECHGSDGMGDIGPSIVEEVREDDDEEIWEVIFEGDDGMPPFTLIPQEVADIVAWLRLQFS